MTSGRALNLAVFHFPLLGEKLVLLIPNPQDCCEINVGRMLDSS